jgi:DNA-binding winged helix-turn-helix (wHTH) protein
VVSKDDLVASVWRGRIVSESALATRINAARSAIGDSGEAQGLIKTLPRKGIRFVGAVREAPKSRTAPAADAAPESARPALALPDKPSIAVLPFTNMSGDPEQEYFADGVAEEIITALSRCHSLFVIARNSSFTIKARLAMCAKSAVTSACATCSKVACDGAAIGFGSRDSSSMRRPAFTSGPIASRAK